ncbi:MAG TPA: chromosome segregation protein SMC [Bacteroidetes bacterium]|nr:chromosome segregation protein SMC [Bacteroidota bacterium]
MRLDRLEIKGFKSFADKTIVHVNEGVTAIVGPNGCGKSNVVDAIRWVLGEQRIANLRLDRMASLIFSGSKTRKASGLAEVTIVFSNTKNILPLQFNEVAISRRLYRSGESTYQINGTTCRLKDIHDLLRGSGISNDLYAIIELGMVDDLLQDRNNARRALIEQAAGVQHFRMRRKEANNKLKGTAQDLERIEDILLEIESNMKILEQQARRAKKYRKWKASYQEVSAERHQVEWFLIQQSIDAFATERASKLEASSAALASMAKLKMSIELENLSLDKASNALKDKQSSANVLQEQVKEIEKNREILKERLTNRQTQWRQANQSIESDQLEMEQSKRDAHELGRTLEVKTADAKAQTLIVDTTSEAFKKEESNMLSIKQEAALAQQRAVEYVNSLSKAEQDLQLTKVRREDFEKEADLISTNHAERSLREQELKTTLDDLERSIEFNGKLLGKEESKEASLTKQLEDNQTATQHGELRLSQASRAFDRSQNEVQLLKSMVQNLEGYPESIKYLTKSANWGSDIPLVSDVLEVEKDYRIAVEQALSAYLNHYIVRNEAEAWEAVSILSKSSKGRAQFIVMDQIKAFKSSTPILDPNLIAATDVVRVDSTYKNVIAWLLDKTYFIRTEDQADVPALLKKYSKFNLISQDGKWSAMHSVIQGGSIGLFEGKRTGRKQQIEKLEKEVKKGKKRIQELEEHLEELKIQHGKILLSRLELDLDEYRSRAQELAQGKLKGTLELEQIQRVSQADADRKTEISKILSDLAKQEKELLAHLDSLKTTGSPDEKVTKLQEKVSQAEQRVGQSREAYFAAQQSLLTMQSECDRIQGELTLRKKFTEQRQARIDTRKERSTQLQLEVDTIEKDLSTQEDALQKAVKQYTEANAGLSEEESAFYAQRDAVLGLEEDLRKAERIRLQLDAELDSNSLKKEALIGQQDSLAVAYEAKWSEPLKIEVHATHDHTESKDFSQELRQNLIAQEESLAQRIQKFGDVNPMAVEAYEAMEGRYSFIIQQRDDMLAAREDLTQTIEAIEKEATMRFNEAFVEIRQYFIETFQTLFEPGDKCDLVLENPEDPLESKITIKAKPKGKKPVVIDQLSGGEKTLTATALLFSMYRLKPAPFCIFDEVDAPLDDRNIQKFNSLIRHYSKETQFILVTHNKQTMVNVNVMYGVTMAEPGVSKVLPVNMNTRPMPVEA